MDSLYADKFYHDENFCDKYFKVEEIFYIYFLIMK